VDGEVRDGIPVRDRGLHYGDGLFETILIRDGMPCLWNRHMQRLALGAERLGFTLPSLALLRDEAARVSAGLDRAVLKMMITRGVGGRGYAPPLSPHPRRILLSYALSSSDEQLAARGVSIRYCSTPASLNSSLAGIKHLNRLDAVLARREWDDPEIAEGLMCDEDGNLVGGTMTNLFVWDGVGLATPGVDRCGIAGTVRAETLEAAARAGIGCVVRPLSRSEVECAVGLFLTNARIGVWPVVQFGSRLFDLDRLPNRLISSIRQAAQTPEWPDR
jgi:4-amino-4-deoxychorismate lyase